MSINCKQCGQKFEVTDEDRKYYEKISPVYAGKKCLIPDPKLCPDCRLQHRLAFRNERKLYHRKCSHCNVDMIAMFSPEINGQVYCKKCWWGDDWSPLDYGKEFDFSKTFAEQFKELVQKVPLPHIVIGGISENSDFTNYTMSLNNCYLVFASDYNEDCCYSTYIFKSKDCFDCTFVSNSELLYECVDSEKSYASAFLQNCQNCRDSFFCFDCRACNDCIGCVGLRNKKYCIFNKQYSKEEYAKMKIDFFEQYKNFDELRKNFEEFKLKFPHKLGEIENCENSTGDHLLGCKNAEHCFDLVEAQDCKYTTLGLKPKDCFDCVGVPNSQLCYQAVASPEDYQLNFTAVIWPISSFLQYCLFCRASKDSFGCVSLHKNQYCILNKQYTKDEYEKLMPKIIEHMISTGEWGEFFPLNVSPFAYNETVANEYFPLERENALKLGANWSDYETGAQFHGEKVRVPDTIKEVDDDILEKVLTCEVTGKLYRVIPQELRFYKKIGLPIPKRCPDQRHIDRMALRSPRKLWNRKCEKCGKEIVTSYSPDCPEIIYCEDCSLKEVY